MADPNMLERYRAAADLTGPRAASREPALLGENYWVNSGHFFFVERGTDGLARPSLAETNGTVKRLIEPAALEAALTDAGCTASPLSLRRARYDLPKPGILIVTIGCEAFSIDLDRRTAAQVKERFDQPELYSPDGRWAVFVEAQDLWVRDRHSGESRPLTSDGETLCAYGQPSETGLAAVSYRRRPHPLGMWSPDSRWFLTHQIDDRGIPESGLVEHVPADGQRPRLHRFRYALPGDSLPIATFVAIELETGRAVRFGDAAFELSSYSPFFLGTVWTGEKDCAWQLRLDRFARNAVLVRLDFASKCADEIYRATSETGFLAFNAFLLGSPNVRVLEASNEFLWYSEEDGWGHLYLHDLTTGARKRQLTEGSWKVRDLLHVDQAQRRAFILAGGLDPNADPARRALCSISLDDGGLDIIATHDGDLYVAPTLPHAGQARPFAPGRLYGGIAPNSSYAATHFGSVVRGDSARIVSLGPNGHRTKAPYFTASHDSGGVVPRHVSALAADGETQLHGLIYLPPGFDPMLRYPLIDIIYPGPQVSQQPQFQRRLKAAPARALAALGFVTLMLDTRGMPVGSRAFHQAGYPKLLEPQLSDHVAVVRQLLETHDFVDAERVGVMGQSGGGAAAARILCTRGDLYVAGVAACGNHDPSLYCALWSDTYRGPAESWDDQESNRDVAAGLERPLLLISGDMDENVLLAQTLGLADALVRANRDFELLVVPGAGHDVLRTSGYAQRRMWDFFVRNLLYMAPPRTFELAFTPDEQADFENRFIQEFRQ